MKDKYCLVSVAPFRTINQSHNNKSVSKQTYSFSRSVRFQPPKPNCPINTYSGNESPRSNSGTAMGFGNKYDFTKVISNSPAAGKYNIPSIFQLNSKQRKGYSVANSRQKILFDSYIDPEQTKYPGIGRYHLEQELMLKTTRAPAFTMSHKTKPIDLRHTIEAQNKNPSPADYQNNPEMSKTLYSSHFKKTSFSQSKSKRFFSKDEKIPGPGHYENQTNLSSIGTYLLSSQRGGANVKFPNQKRVTKFDDAIREGKTKPGPGYYRTVSEFGQYDGEVYHIKVDNHEK